MKLTLKIKLLPTKFQSELIKDSMDKYIKAVNATVDRMIEADDYLKLSSKDIDAKLPSALRGQIVLDSKSVFKKIRKKKKQITLKKPVAIWNNQNYRIIENAISFPVLIDGKTKFFGNGRQNKYIKRKFRSKRKELGKAKKQSKINSLSNKEQRYMKDQDHKVSRQIVAFALLNNVSVIRMEKLTNIRNAAKTSRKNEKNLHTWSFYRLASFIEYKAELEGIKVEYVDPKYTSQICPNCGTKNHARDRKYKCSCGFKTHRDRVGAINIINAPVIDGNSLSA